MKLESYHEMKAFCDKNKLLQSGQRVLVAFSGGADSVYLTLALQELSKEWDFALELLHVNHQIRGEEAGRDEAFCRSFAAQQGLKLHVCSGDVPKMGQEQKCSLEEAARKYRYQCIEELVEREDFDRVAVAHHQDDQAETVLFRCCVEAACAVWEACGLVMESTFVRCFSCGTETLSVNWDSADSPGVRTVPIRRRTAVAIRYD